MGRPRTYDDRVLFDAAKAVLRERGLRGLDVRAVCHAAGVPSGVVYNRFPSREALLAETWLVTVAGFQEAFLASLAEGDLPRTAAFVVDWARAHPGDAGLLLVHRVEDFIGTGDAERSKRATDLRRRLSLGFARAAKRTFPSLAAVDAVERIVFAVVRIPEAAVRPYLVRGAPIPASVAKLVNDALRGIVDGAFPADHARV